MIAAILAFAALQMVSNEASPPPVPPTNGGGERWGFEPSHPELNLAYEREARALQAEMHSLQESDGGKLTAEHRAYVEQKLKALLDDYHRGVRRVDPTAINADGSTPH